MSELLPNLIDKKKVEIPTADGGVKEFYISKIPAFDAREIVCNYPVSGIPKLGDYKQNEEMVLKMMGYVGVETGEGHALTLSTKALINNHVPEWESLARLEKAMIEYNCSFFEQGKISTFLEGLAEKYQPKISSMLTDFLVPLLNQEKPPSES